MIKRDQAAPVVAATGINSWIHHLSFSPDGLHLACSPQDRRLLLIGTDAADPKVKRVLDQGPAYVPGSFSWSPDSAWIAATRLADNGRSLLTIHRIAEPETYILSDGMTDDREPEFSPDGKHLFFVSARDYELTFSGYEFNYVYTDPRDLFVMMLDPAAPPLFPERVDATTKWSPPEEKSVPETTVVEPAFAAGRVIRVPGVPKGNCTQLTASRTHLFYARSEDGKRNLYRYDIVERKEERVLSEVSTFQLSGDHKRVLYRSGSTLGVTAATPDRPAKDGALDLKGLTLRIDTEAEWAQMYWDTWRITREWFYDPNMHGFDWKALGSHYERLLKRVHHRMDFDFILG
ncbi:MAG TPA: hypothetical protein PKA37_18250, partial [Planctomycetota bacterium]|nr:hypothetical protein [Planctomycetota bacterium]